MKGEEVEEEMKNFFLNKERKVDISTIVGRKSKNPRETDKV